MPPKRVKDRQLKRKESETVAWIGTSISKALDKNKFKNDNKVKLKIVKAYGITEDEKTPFPRDAFRFPSKNFKAVVPEVLEDENINTVILQTGSIEITNIKVNEAGDGKPFDHLVVLMLPLASILYIPPRQYRTVTTRPIPQSGIDRFGALLILEIKATSN